MKRLKLGFAWLLVAIPLTWGAWQSVKKSMPLFTERTAVRGQ